MPKKEVGYENLKEKAARGEYTLVEPLDYIIIENLPDEGTMFAGVAPLGETAQAIVKKFPAEAQKLITTANVSSRLRVLHAQGIVLRTATGFSTRSNVWQRTKLGVKLLEEWNRKPTKGGGDGGSR